MKWNFWIDRGGTFTDVLGQTPQGKVRALKLLSDNPERYPDAALEGIRRLLGLVPGEPFPLESIGEVKMGTTVATNALLTRAGESVVLLTSKGLGDMALIGDQSRADIFALAITKPSPLHCATVEVAARVDVRGDVLAALDEEELVQKMAPFLARGIQAVAVAFPHAHAWPEQERQAGRVLQRMGLAQVSLSHQCSGLMGFLGRTRLALADAYLSPVLRRHTDFVTRQLPQTRVLFMQSHGGLALASHFRGKDAVLSGPAGGVVGAAKIAQRAGIASLITFDMGGTSTDVAHWEGELVRTTESVVGDIPLRTPMLAIHTVAAGGGSVCSFDGGKYCVGPESAGADPGPACYLRGGPVCITDSNLLLGILRPQHFPKAFGPSGDQPLGVQVVREKFQALAKDISQAMGRQLAPQDIAQGFIDVAIEEMALAIERITLERGRSCGGHTLCCFGGAGGQHACMLADRLGIEQILIHPFAGILSAQGIGLAEIRCLHRSSVERPWGEIDKQQLESILQEPESRGIKELNSQGVGPKDIQVFRRLGLRYQGGHSVVNLPFEHSRQKVEQDFQREHRKLYGLIQDQPLILASVEVEVVEKRAEARAKNVQALPCVTPDCAEQVEVWLGGRMRNLPLYHRKDLPRGSLIDGPALIVEEHGTNLVAPDWTARVDQEDNLLLKRQATKRPGKTKTTQDPALLALFNRRFMSIAEKMGVVLARCAHSVNIKERRDFSCALFDREGNLIANAPHVPVHLGSMGQSVRSLLQTKEIRPAEVYALNDPYAGGTHLPDITVVTPFFQGGVATFFVASRGHHADIGGITPGSMPPHSTHIEQEGILLQNITLVREERLQEKEMRRLLTQGRWPARNPDQNLADLKAQIAANQTGLTEMEKLITEYGEEMVHAYVSFVRDNARMEVERTLDKLRPGHFVHTMDGGEKVAVSISIKTGQAIIDFAGTSPQSPGNLNAPTGICRAALLYVFRTLIDKPIPMNEGILAPLVIRIPEGCLLNPTFPAAVAGGNVETSQAVVEALYGALNILAGSQGTMNNFSWGNADFQCYETLGGGTGACANFAGADAVHCHMTNSRLTDLETLEWNFPVLLEELSIRHGSAGKGVRDGGNGITRRLRFLANATASILSGGRLRPPRGANGGGSGACGRNAVYRSSGAVEELPGSATVKLNAQDVFVMETPGGGGWGRPVQRERP